jgi:TolA-binding protein
MTIRPGAIRATTILFFLLPTLAWSADRRPITLPEDTGNMGKQRPTGEAEPAGPASQRQFEQSQFDERARALQQRKSTVRQNKIRKLKDLLRKNPHYAQKDSLYHRLAEAMWDEAKYRFMLDMDEYANRMEAFDAGTLAVEPKAPMEDYSDALEFYRKVQREFPKYFRIDEVTYRLAKSLLLEGENKRNPNLSKEGVRNLKKVVTEFPRSKYVAEAQLALAEYYFENNSMFFAKERYEAIINNHKRAGMFNYALYKLAWVYYNLREFEKGIDTFKKVVEVISATGTGTAIEFREQALNDLIRVFAEVDNSWVRGREYFNTQMTEEKTYVKLRKIGDLLLGMDKDEEAISLYQHFIKKFPTSDEAIGWWENILGVRVEQQVLAQVEKDTRVMVAFFNRAGLWVKTNSSNRDLIADSYKATERRLLWIATKFHQEAVRLKQEKYYFTAASLYDLFVQEFDDSKHAYRVNFFYAEILFSRHKNFEDALKQYQAVLGRDNKGDYTEDAAIGAVFCFDELMAAAGVRERAQGRGNIKRIKLSEGELKKKRQIKEATELHELEKGFVGAVDKYVEIVSKWLEDPEVLKKDPERGARIPEMSYIAAQMLYDHGQYRDAVKRLQVIFDHFPKHKFAAYAVNMLIDCYARLNRWAQVEEWANKLIKAGNFKVKSKRELNKIRAIAIAEDARELALQKDYSNALKRNLIIYKEFRKARSEDDRELAAIALFNNAVIHENARNIPSAIKTYTKVRKEFPKASIAPQAQYVIGQIFESQTRFAEAAKAFELMEKFKTNESAPDAILNAGLIWEAIGKPKKAIKVYKKYIKLFSKRADTPAIAFRICVLQEEMGGKKNLKSALKAYKKFVKKYKASQAMVVEAYCRAAYITMGLKPKRNRKSATKLYEKVLEEFATLKESGQPMGQAKYYAARAAFELAEFLYLDFHDIELTEKTLGRGRAAKKIKKMKEIVQAKAEAHQTAEKAFEAIGEYLEPQWAASASYRVALLYYEFARMLLDAPIPDGLPVEFEDEYSYFLEQKAAPVEEKALIMFKQALDYAHQKRVYNDWTKRAAEYAAKVNPDAYPVAEEKEVSHDHTLDTLGSASLITDVKRGEISIDMGPQRETPATTP